MREVHPREREQGEQRPTRARDRRKKQGAPEQRVAEERGHNTGDGERHRDRRNGKHPHKENTPNRRDQHHPIPAQRISAHHTAPRDPPHSEGGSPPPPEGTGHHRTRARAPTGGNTRDTRPPCGAGWPSPAGHNTNHTSRVHQTESCPPAAGHPEPTSGPGTG